MSITTKCDTCGRGLDDSGPYPAFAVTVEVKRMPNLSGSELGVMVRPDLPIGRHDFCGKDCFVKWIAAE